MNSLWLETCLGSFYVAVSSDVDGSVQSVESVFDANPRNANKLISSSVSGLLKSSGLSSSSIDQVYLSKGPGSFTGIKLAAAYALGFSFSHPNKIPIMAYDALQCLAKMSSKNLVLKSTSKTGFYSNGMITKNVSAEEVSSLDDICFWNEWVGYSDQPQAQNTPVERKQEIYDQLVQFVQKHKELSESFQKANYLKEPEINSKGTS